MMFDAFSHANSGGIFLIKSESPMINSMYGMFTYV